MRPVSVAFVDDHPVFLAGLTSLFANIAGFEVVATGATAADAVQIAAETSPDILMMDISRPDDTFEAVRQITSNHGSTRVLVFAALPSVDHAVMALRNASIRKMAVQALRLSAREDQIVGLLFRGRTNKEIATVLSISEKTVKHYMTILMQKLRVRNRLEVVLQAQKMQAYGREMPKLQ